MSKTHKPIDSKRRAAVLGSLGGAAAVTAWHKPLVNAVVLPAHAQASVVTSFFASGVTPTLVQNKSILDHVVEPAVAGDMMEIPPQQTYIVVATQTDADGEVFDIGVFESFFPRSGSFSEVQYLYEGSVNTTTGGTLPVTEIGCTNGVAGIDVEIVSVSESGMELNFTSRMQNLMLAPGSETLPTPVCITRPLADNYFNPGGFDLASGRKDSLMDLMVPEAHAGLIVQLSNFGLRAIKASADIYIVETLTENGAVIHAGPLEIGAATSVDLPFVSDACEQDLIDDPMPLGPPLSARITAINPFEIQVLVEPSMQEAVTVTARSGDGTLMPNCNLNGT